MNEPARQVSVPRTLGLLLTGLFSLARATGTSAQQIGEVDTVFKLVVPDSKIVVDAYDDPKVTGVTCYVSRAKTGGLKGAVGIAEDRAEASIACRQTGKIAFAKPPALKEEVLTERESVRSKSYGWCA